MATEPVNDLVERGREAAARGSWREAYDLLVSADPEELSPEDLELIGEATSWTGPTERCIEALERAFSAYLAAGDRRGASRVALALVRGYGLALADSVASGWSKRAERLLEEEPECPSTGTSLAGKRLRRMGGATRSRRSGCSSGRSTSPSASATVTSKP